MALLGPRTLILREKLSGCRLRRRCRCHRRRRATSTTLENEKDARTMSGWSRARLEAIDLSTSRLRRIHGLGKRKCGIDIGATMCNLDLPI